MYLVHHPPVNKDNPAGSATAASGENSRIQRRILMVDDTDAARVLAVRTLIVAGYEVTEARHGRAALGFSLASTAAP